MSRRGTGDGVERRNMRKATQSEESIAADEAQARSLITGEVLREKGLCPLVVVRTRGAGVHVGYLARIDPLSRSCELLESRRLWRWYGANTLSEVALEGVSGAVRLAKPERVKPLFDVSEICEVSPKAAPSLTESRWL